jgi:hypothetical protein
MTNVQKDAQYLEAVAGKRACSVPGFESEVLAFGFRD